MIRISRIIAKERIADLLDLNFVSKIELRQGKQGFNNPAICRVEIYLLLENDKEYFNSKMTDIMSWAQKNKCNIAFTTASMALKDGFIKESAFDDFNYQFLKSIKHYVIFIQQVTLIYLIEESYNGRQVRRII